MSTLPVVDDSRMIIVRSMEELLQHMSQHQPQQPATVDQIQSLDEKTSIAIFIYSLSEMILRSSLYKEMRLLQDLLGYCINTAHNRVHLFTSMHSSLHELSTISHVTSMMDAVVTIVPNDGSSMSSEVAAELHIVRRSQNSTKIAEDIEMLEWKDNVLQPRLSVSQKIVEIEHESSQNNNSTNNNDSSNNEYKVFPKAHSRLITFESTDPEFDEDDDPDADLDL
jgi:hypothetical protein